jgi:CBS domain containing-hemolysin-like protein
MRALEALPALQRRYLLDEARGGGGQPEAADGLQGTAATGLRVEAATLSLLSLALLALLARLAWPGWSPPLAAASLLAYIWVMDIALPALVASSGPAAWVERLLPLFAPLRRMASPFLAPAFLFRERHQPDQERAGDDDAPQAEDAMAALLEEGEAEGILEQEDSELIRNVVNLGDTIVREVMTPRNRMQAIPSTASLDEAWEAFRTKRHSRMPIYLNSIDSIQGVLLLKDLIQLRDGDGGWLELAKAPVFVPESKPTRELLRELQLARTQMAIVVDEYGAVAGLATVEDLLEEVVGEIQEEHEDSLAVQECSPGVYSVPGETRVDDLADRLGVEIGHEGFDTVAGLVMWKLGRVPGPLETVQADGLALRVLKVQGQRIVLVEVRPEG